MRHSYLSCYVRMALRPAC